MNIRAYFSKGRPVAWLNMVFDTYGPHLNSWICVGQIVILGYKTLLDTDSAAINFLFWGVYGVAMEGWKLRCAGP